MVPFGDLHKQYVRIQTEIDAAIREVLDSGWFILGKQGEAFEQEFASYCGARYGIGVGSGTEALHLALLAVDVEPGDEVITVPNTTVPTVSAITFAQAIPRFVDIDPVTYLMDVELLTRMLYFEVEQKRNKRIKVIIPVHLYGQCVDMNPILELAQRYNLIVIEDAAQAHGAEYKGQKAGMLSDIGCFSFYPSKNLGAFGDGGMIITNNPEFAERARLLRNYGQEKRYYHKIKGFNSRLDEMQAAILRKKLRHLDDWNYQRRQHAALYHSLLEHEPVITPVEAAQNKHVYHLYVIRTQDRDRLQSYLEEHGVGILIHYPIPVHLQEAYADLGIPKGTFPVAEGCAGKILSLPMFPELEPVQIEEICSCIHEFHMHT
jgi:dTDP-4-amino-4,6-dideoxygalactose transaminase